MKYLVLAIALACAPAFAKKIKDDRTAVNRLTCAQAIQYVEDHKMFWLETKYDGDIPFYPVMPMSNANPYCKESKEVLQAIFVPTLDNPDCFVGRNCRKAN